MTSKSIRLSHSRIAVCLLCAFVINNLIDCVESSRSTYKEMEIIDDLPLKTDFDKYLISLEKLIYFVNVHRSFVDINLNFGIFLTSVNLKQTMKIRGHGLSAQERVRLERLLKTNDEIELFFFAMIRIYVEHMNINDDTPIGISSLFSNELAWPNHMTTFNIELLKKTKFYTRRELEDVLFKWPLFKARVENYHRRPYPRPSESDVCLELLSQNINNDNPKLVHCHVPFICAKRVVNGTNFGYGKLQRVLFLILARFSRGCTLLSPEEDINLLDSLCASAYNEAEFIAYHGFETANLLMEIMSLCSLEGHAQFLRRSWIEELMDHQSALGWHRGQKNCHSELLLSKICPGSL